MEETTLNIALVASQGGHSGQMGIIFKPEVIGNHNAVFITESPDLKKKIKEKDFQGKYRSYFFKKDHLGANPFRYLKTTYQLMRIYKKEKIDLVITNGAHISVPAVVAARFLRIRTIFLDTFIRVNMPNWSARLSYPFSDTFLVQHENMKKKYGKKSKHRGSVL